jgi:hypothetical protein
MNDNLDIPVTTLAGLTSISDCKSTGYFFPSPKVLTRNFFFLAVLSELPLSDSLPSNKTLLFHPRVAEEANNVLSQRDDVLAQQLISAIEQTNSSHM